MKLLKLVLLNFQGVKSLTLDFDGKSASIMGDNGTGKTTVYNALTWLLFDKSSTGAKGFTPKTRGKDGELHNLEHSSEGVFQTDDGSVVTLKKTYHEVYKKKRGDVKAEFSGHTVEYFIDGVPTKEKDFTARVLDYCGGDEEKIRILTMPDYFPEQMSWEDRRAILVDMCGEISESDVISSNPELSELPSFLKMPGDTDRMYTVDEYRKISTAKKVEINKQLTEIPARIDEAARMMDEAMSVDVESVKSQIATLDKQYQELIEKKANYSGSVLTDLKKELQEARLKVLQEMTEYVSKTSAETRSTDESLGKKKRELDDIRVEIRSKEKECELIQADVDRMVKTRGELLEQYRTVQAREWDESKSVCPTCGRPFSPEKAQELRESFLLERSNALEEINLRGRKEASAYTIAEYRGKIKMLQEEITVLKDRESVVSEEISKLESIKSNVVPFENTPRYEELRANVKELERRCDEARRSTDDEISSIDAQMKDIMAKRDEQEHLKASAAVALSAKSRVDELEKMERSLGAAYEELEHGLYLCDVYTKTLVDMLTEKINGKFKSVRFRLFQPQINGGLKEDCEVMVPSSAGNMVPYSIANNAARLNAGLEIIDTLSEYWGVRMPVVLDNAESVTHPYKMKEGQFIRLVVSEGDKTLRLVTE